jgi:trans-2,3-dihydro-3-hydroxyanthranilate isomerase
MGSVAFETVDVFTTTRFGGNPLAVVPDAASLTAEQMQAITREFNYSESTFVLPPADPANTARVRIFTPASEIPFAGHPNVGTAYVLAKLAAARGEAADAFRFEEGAGLVEVDILREGGEVAGARIRAPQGFSRGVDVAPQDIAACLGLDPAEVLSRNHGPLEASVGLSFIFAELASLEALGRVKARIDAFEDACARYKEAGLRFSIFAYVRLGDRPERVRARMLAPLSGVPEDPATGSASCALGGLLASLDPRPDADLAVSIDQGVEMGRPSRLEVTVASRGGAVADVRVAGGCAPVMAGRIEV